MSLMEKKVTVGWWKIVLVVLTTICLMVFARSNSFVYPFSRIMLRICGMFFLSVFFVWALKNEQLKKVLEWLGTYSLELYLLHMLLYQPFKNFGIEHMLLITISIMLSLLLCKPVHMITQKISDLL